MKPEQQCEANIEVKCVICGHKWITALTREMPCCMICMGPVTVVKAERKLKAVPSRGVRRG